MLSPQLPGPVGVVDVETTGLFPFRHDRVVEVAAVVLRGDGSIEREFVSLVNPSRDIGPSSIHGLTSDDILHAPQFCEIAPLLVETLNGTVAIAGHNVRFDLQFLESEFSRAGCPLPECFSICTMQLAGGGRLVDCCRDYGVGTEDGAHHALADARAAARLLSILLADEPRLVRELGTLPPIQWPAIWGSARRAVTREESRRRQSEPPSFLQRLLGRVHGSAEPIASDGPVLAYVALLNRVLEDRHVDDSEGDALISMAEKWGLSGQQIRLAHCEYLNQLALAALADGVVTEAERRDLVLVARLLGQERDLEEILRKAAAQAPVGQTLSPPTSSADNSLAGKRVCFTGECQCCYGGQIISRELAEELATEAGLVVMSSVTKKLDLLVVADPQSQSGKAKKARQYGIRILHEPVFWKAIGVRVE